MLDAINSWNSGFFWSRQNPRDFKLLREPACKGGSRIMKPSIRVTHRIQRHCIPQAVITAIVSLGKRRCGGRGGLSASLEDSRFGPPRQTLRGACGRTPEPGQGLGGGRRAGILLDRRLKAKPIKNDVQALGPPTCAVCGSYTMQTAFFLSCPVCGFATLIQT